MRFGGASVGTSSDAGVAAEGVPAGELAGTARIQPDTERVYLSVDQCSRGGLQLSVGIEHADGGGHGYRIFGPKYDGGGKQLRRHYLTDRDVQELTDYLKKVRP